MFNRPNRNDINDDAQDVRNDVSQLADTLEEVLKSWGSDAKDEADAAKRKAQSLLRETRARMNGRSRASQAACDAMSCANTFVREKPMYALGTVAAVGIFIGALLSLRK
ncbi:DUF883 domain-containing protein [Enterobacter sp. KBR-315C3_2022]|jgi:Uncharacterized conserved protein|uniref:DUF883 domain-containing protein n=1 Tax=Enterobacter sp. KBR-315C3_2022 TaxID=3242494 RepID=UPI0027828865|nr:DUF883 domain-containing protein [Enterobacter chengduensis]